MDDERASFVSAVDSDPRRTHGLYLLIFVGIATFFVLARSWSIHSTVFPDSGDVQLVGVDSYFHLRHATWSAAHFPDQLRRDPGARYPNHGRQQVTGLFNLMIAATALVGTGFDPSLDDVATAAAWAPVMLSLLTLWVLFRFAAGLAGPAAGMAAALFFTVYPGTSLTRGMLGFGDQHVAEFLLALLSVAGLVHCLRQSLGQSSYRPALLLSLPWAAFFYSWLGTPMYIAVMALAIFSWLLVELLGGRELHQAAKGLFRFFCGAALWQLLVILLWPELLMELVRGMRWWNLSAMVGFAVLPLGLAAVVDRPERSDRTSVPANSRRWITAAVLIVLVGTAVWLFFTEVPRGRTFSRWLLGERGQQIAEQQIATPAMLWRLFGPAGILAAISVPVALVRGVRSDGPAHAVLPIIFGAGITAIWLRTHDFDYVPPVFLALMAACAVAWLHERITAGLTTRVNLFSTGRRTALRSGTAVGLLLILLIPAWPLQSTRSPWIKPESIDGMVLHRAEWFDAMRWMQASTPVPGVLPTTALPDSFAGPYPDGVYGVMSAWDVGNFIASHGSRLPVASRFPSRRAARWLTATSTTEADSLLCSNCRPPEHVRYVVLDANTSANLFLAKARAARRTPRLRTLGFWQTPDGQVPEVDYGAFFDSTMSTRLFWRDGDGLGGFRLMYDSPQSSVVYFRYDPDLQRIDIRSELISNETELKRAQALATAELARVAGGYAYNAVLTPALKIFEVVPGARLTGRAPPGDTVRAELDLVSATSKRRFTFRQSAVADTSGRYRFRLPYPTIDAVLPTTVQATGPYRIRIGDNSDLPDWRIDVSEASVLGGAVHRIIE